MSGIRGCARKGKIKLTAQVMVVESGRTFYTQVFVHRSTFLHATQGFQLAVFIIEAKIEQKYIDRGVVVEVIKISPTVRRA